MATEELYGDDSVFTADEQSAMRRGYTYAERIKISGSQFGCYPQAISQDHADKLDRLNFGE
jgi:hypothetical protein